MRHLRKGSGIPLDQRACQSIAGVGDSQPQKRQNLLDPRPLMGYISHCGVGVRIGSTLLRRRRAFLVLGAAHMQQSANTLERRIKSAIAGVVIGLASLLPLSAGKADAGIITVDSSMSTSQINTTIAASNPGDTIEWQSGTYTMMSRDEHYTFLGDRDYTFGDDVLINSNQTEEGYIFNAIGSNINITAGKNVIMQHNKIGIIGNYSPSNRNPPLLTNINISGITSYASESHYEWQNLTNTAQERTSPDINFSNMVLNGGITGFHFSRVGKTVNGKTPYLSLKNNIADGLSSILIDLPIRQDTGTFVDGQNYIDNNILMNSNAIVTETLYPLFTSPANLAQKNVTNPYINPAKNDFVLSDPKFILGTLIPQHNSPLNLGEGNYIGAYVPEGTAKIRGVNFSVNPTSDSHEKFRTSDLWIEFAGDNIGIPTENGWKIDLKYKVEYFLSDPIHPDSIDQLLATTTNHITYISPNEVDMISPPDFHPQEFLVPEGEWDIYARITSYASDGLDFKLEADIDKYFDITQFSQYDSSGYRVTGLPEPATLALLGLGSFLLLYKEGRKE